jgi:ArsR family transcriptional regulator, arsenate/arsenite/antimonite-responsive transcriptional repressor
MPRAPGAQATRRRGAVVGSAEREWVDVHSLIIPAHHGLGLLTAFDYLDIFRYVEVRSMREAGLVKVLRALADRKRIRMTRAIAAAGELSCGQVKALFPLSQPTISHHLKILADAGVIAVREAGQHRFISVNLDLLHEIADVLPGSVRSTAARKRKRA